MWRGRSFQSRGFCNREDPSEPKNACFGINEDQFISWPERAGRIEGVKKLRVLRRGEALKILSSNSNNFVVTFG